MMLSCGAFQKSLFAQNSQDLLEKATRIHFDYPDSALQINKELEALAKARGSLDTMAIARNKQGALYYLKSDYVQSMKDFSQAYEWAFQANNAKEIAYAESGRGLIYLGQLQYEKAIEVFYKVLNINEERADSTRISRNLFNIGICERELNNNEESLAYFNRAILYIQSRPLDYFYVMVLNQKAKSLYKLMRYDEALTLYNNVLTLDTISNTWELAFAYTGIAEISLDRKNYEEALINSQKGYNYAEQIGALWDKTRAINVMWQAEEATGKDANALRDAKLYIAFKDSLYNREKDLVINSAQLELATLKNENLENSLKLANEKQRYTLSVFIGSTIIIILLIILVFHFQKTIRTINTLNDELSDKNIDFRKQKNELEEINKAKNQIFSIVSHDMRGPIGSVIQILDMEKAGDLSKEEKTYLDDMLHTQLERTRDMMDEMLHWANNQMDGLKKNLTKVDLVNLVNEEEHKIEISLQAKKINFVFENHTEDASVLIDANQLKVILQNLISNAIKFSHVNGVLTIKLREKPGFKLIEIIDNGVGMDQATLKLVQTRNGKIPSKKGTLNEQGSGIGLLLTNQLMKANNIDLAVESTLGNGSTFTICIPVK